MTIFFGGGGVLFKTVKHTLQSWDIKYYIQLLLDHYYLVIQRESNIQFALPVEHISHVEVTTWSSDVICAIYSWRMINLRRKKFAHVQKCNTL